MWATPISRIDQGLADPLRWIKKHCSKLLRRSQPLARALCRHNSALPSPLSIATSTRLNLYLNAVEKFHMIWHMNRRTVESRSSNNCLVNVLAIVFIKESLPETRNGFISVILTHKSSGSLALPWSTSSTGGPKKSVRGQGHAMCMVKFWNYSTFRTGPWWESYKRATLYSTTFASILFFAWALPGFDQSKRRLASTWQRSSTPGYENCQKNRFASGNRDTAPSWYCPRPRSIGLPSLSLDGTLPARTAIRFRRGSWTRVPWLFRLQISRMVPYRNSSTSRKIDEGHRVWWIILWRINFSNFLFFSIKNFLLKNGKDLWSTLVFLIISGLHRPSSLYRHAWRRHRPIVSKSDH